MTVDITFEKDEDPRYWGTSQEGDKWINTIHFRTGKVTVVFQEGTKAYEVMRKMLLDLDERYLSKHDGIRKIKASNECKCGEKFYIQKMLSELQTGMMRCQHDGKTRDLKGNLL